MIRFAFLIILVISCYTTYGQHGLNSLRTWTAVKRTVNADDISPNSPVQNFPLVTQYEDGFGRPVQIVVKEGSLDNLTEANTDLVQPMVYDAFGRLQFHYLPFPDDNKNGTFTIEAIQKQFAYYNNPNGILLGQSEDFYYSQSIFDGSPLNRVMKTMAPGNSWVGSQVGLKYEYKANTAIEKVHIWDIAFVPGSLPSTSAAQVYPDGELYKNIITDENGKDEINYTDKSGNLVLRKVQNEDNVGSGLSMEHAGWLCTYYVYDDFGRLRSVIPPKAVVYLDTHTWILSTDVFDELCFSYEYDSKGRMVVKKSPGADAVYFVYDHRDRVVFTQDGNQRSGTPKKWIATLYDNLDRTTLTGIIEYGGNRQDLQNHVNSIINTGSNGTIQVNTSAPPVVNLAINHREQNVLNYAATKSITFNQGFESETGANFIAEITAASITENNIVTANANPLPPGTNLYMLTLTYYDDYSYSGAKTFSPNFTIDNTLPVDEKEEVKKSSRTLGYVTGTKVRLLDDSNTFLTTTSFYDDKGRMIQIAGDNHKGFTDVVTTQYDFSGKVRSTYEVNRFDGTDGVKIFTKHTYDVLGRVTAITKSINGSTEKIIATYAYDALGRLANKKLAPGFAGPDGAQLESLDYTYNIHGWLLGINKTYATSATEAGHFFGMELGYDKAGSAEFAQLQINGNIAGNAWKSRGDNVPRKYDYSYDNVNQLNNAAFNQQNSPGTGWTKEKMDFTSNYTYDENGNIKTQNQWGVAIGNSPQQIDQLNYNYDMVAGGWSNRLKQIEEYAATGMNGHLGDFKNGTAGGNVQQYTYDANGNLLKDLNKEIDNSSAQGITYNYMNLPTLITFKNTNKTIAYVYDAAGNKLRKILDEPAHDNKPARHIETDYLNGFVYQNNELQFFVHEEGRVRKTENGAFVYDYFIKDHLSNTRMVLTEEQQVDHYPTATLEGSGTGSALSQEQDYYDINSSYVVNKPTNVSPSNLLDYINDNGTDNPHTFGNKNAVSQKMYRLNSATNWTGYSKILKVMAGDKIDILAKSYYHYSGGNIPKNTLLAADIISAFLGVAGGGNAAVQHGATSSILNGNNAGLVLPLNIFTNSNPENPLSHIKAGLNYIVFDENFNYVSAGYDPVSGEQAGGLKNHFIQNIEIPQNGYIYIYCSNESNIDLFFDNLEIIHTRGQILEENHYYSYGLKIAAISSKAAGALQNRYLYQGDFSEYDEETGYNEFDLRHYDAQTGRWTTTDPYQQFASPYLGMGNSPGGMVDPDGGSIINYWNLDGLNHFADAFTGALIGGIIGAIDNGWEGAKTGMAIGAGMGLGAGFVNWGSVGEAIGNAGNWVGGLFQNNNYWILYQGQKAILYHGLYDNLMKSKEKERFKASSGIVTYEDPNGKVIGNDYRNSAYQFTKVTVNEGGVVKTINVGPIPDGHYSINLSLNPNRNWKLDKNGNSIPGFGIEQIGSGYPEWGTVRARLEILSGTNTQGRDFFYFHNSVKGYSHGCIETQTGLFTRLYELKKGGARQIKVRVKYESLNTSAYGSTDKD